MLVALLLAATALAAPAAPAQSPSAVEAPARADAIALVRIVNPERPMIEMVVRNFEDIMRQTIQSNDDYIEMEKESPGVSAALVAATSKVMLADVIADAPALRLRYARFYADHFTPEETAELIRFYSSSAGQRMVAAKFAKLDAKPLMSEFAEDPDSKVSQKHIRDMNSAAARSIASDMSDDDKLALLDFMKSPAFLKLAQIRGEFEKLEADIANEPDPMLDKAIEDAVKAVIQKYTAGSTASQAQ